MTALAGNSLRGVRLALAALCVAQFATVLEVTIVATALPTISADLGFHPGGVAWVITSYTVVLAGLLILGGRIADLAGTRLMFGIGLGVFTAASVGCALAWSPWALIAARIVQGAGAALLSPAALAALNELVTSADARRRALGWWTAAAAGGGAGGWVVGGLIVQTLGWRWLFAVIVPIGLVTLLVSPRVLGRLRRAGDHERRPLDLPGAVSVTAGIALVALALSRVAEDPLQWAGWVPMVLGAVLLGYFVRHERRVGSSRYVHAAQPLVPGRLVRTPGVVGGNLTAAALTGCTSPAMLTVVFYVQDTLRLPPADGGLLFPAFNAAAIAGSLLGPKLLLRIRALSVLLAGFAGVVIGIAVLLTLPARGLPIGTLIASFVLMGAGLGAASVASTTAGTANVASADLGVAAGLLNSTAELGTALGVALSTPLVARFEPMVGYRLGFSAAIVIGLLGAASAFTVRDAAEPAAPSGEGSSPTDRAERRTEPAACR
jgi:MFS family permease